MFMRNLFIAFLPAAVIGAVMIKYIKALFHNPGVFVVTLIVGGLIMLWVERKPQYAKTAVPGADAQGDDSVSSRRATAHALKEISWRSEEHTSELQSLMRISYAVFCLKKKNKTSNNHIT